MSGKLTKTRISKLIDELKKRVVKIDYRKADGSDTTLDATLNSSLIEEKLGPKPEKKETYTPRENALTVFSLDRMAFRTLKHDSITNFK
jgi:hypothetical protein